MRDDLEEVLKRRAATPDAARPEAAETRGLIAATLAAAAPPGEPRRFVDTW